jgi:radical SAM protein with 4Fe4S-binding SPASM domain
MTPFLFAAKMANYGIVNGQRLLGTRRVIGAPYYVVLDPSTACQLECPFCDGKARKSRLMDFTRFKEIIDEIGRYCINLELYNWGEPTMNRDLIRMINYSSAKYKLYTRISSHLNLSDDNFYRELVLSRLNALIISLDGASEETYRKYRVKGSFATVVRNIELIVSYKRHYRKDEPKLVWQFLVFRHNEHEIKNAQEMAKELGVNEIAFRKPHVPAWAKAWDSSIPAYSNYIPTDTKSGTPSCNWPYSALAINSDGSISPCCGIAHTKDDFGSVDDGRVLEVWQNQKFQVARQYVSERRVAESSDNVCARCEGKGSINLAPNLAQVFYYLFPRLRRLWMRKHGLAVRL